MEATPFGHAGEEMEAVPFGEAGEEIKAVSFGEAGEEMEAVAFGEAGEEMENESLESIGVRDWRHEETLEEMKTGPLKETASRYILIKERERKRARTYMETERREGDWLSL
jgi:hypothetical protein